MNLLSPLAVAVLLPTALVVVAVAAVLWRERTSSQDARVAIASGIVLAIWATATTVLARRGFFQPSAGATVPPVGIDLIVVLLALTLCLSVSVSLRRLLRNQANLIRLHLWRLEGLVFLILMVQGRVPALWAVPAGVGDVLVGATAPWVARAVDRPGGRRQPEADPAQTTGRGAQGPRPGSDREHRDLDPGLLWALRPHDAGSWHARPAEAVLRTGALGLRIGLRDPHRELRGAAPQLRAELLLP